MPAGSEANLGVSCLQVINTTKYRVRNCAFLVANATKNVVLATRSSKLVAS